MLKKNFLAKRGEQIEDEKETAKNCLTRSFLLFFCFIIRFVGDKTEVKEPQNVTIYTVKFKYPTLSLHLWPYTKFQSLYAFKLLDCLSWI